jgi:phage antirepressor YoqD-like protein
MSGELVKCDNNDKLDNKKAEIVDYYVKALGNITDTCKLAGISRWTFYRWLKENEEFKKAIDNANVNEYKKDFIENALLSLVQKKNPAAVIFAAKTQLKDRGYIEKSEVEHSGTMTILFDRLNDEV